VGLINVAVNSYELAKGYSYIIVILGVDPDDWQYRRLEHSCKNTVMYEIVDMKISIKKGLCMK